MEVDMSGASQVFSGTWEEIAEKHSDELAGHRVEVRIVDEDAAKARAERFRESMRRIRELAPPAPALDRIFTAEDIYSDHL